MIDSSCIYSDCSRNDKQEKYLQLKESQFQEKKKKKDNCVETCNCVENFV